MYRHTHGVDVVLAGEQMWPWVFQMIGKLPTPKEALSQLNLQLASLTGSQTTPWHFFPRHLIPRFLEQGS